MFKQSSGNVERQLGIKTEPINHTDGEKTDDWIKEKEKLVQ